MKTKKKVKIAPTKKAKKKVKIAPTKKAKIVPIKKTCGTCYGLGMWATGDPSPMGPMDAEDGMPTMKCPECGANRNPIGD